MGLGVFLGLYMYVIKWLCHDWNSNQRALLSGTAEVSCLRTPGGSESQKRRKKKSTECDEGWWQGKSKFSFFGSSRSFLDICVHPCLAVPRLEVFRVKYMSEGGFGFCTGILGWVGTATPGVLGHDWQQKEAVHHLCGSDVKPLSSCLWRPLLTSRAIFCFQAHMDEICARNW